MSDPSVREPLQLTRRTPLLFGRIVVIGGGCYGSWYTGQLHRAMVRNALRAREIIVVDRDPACRVATQLANGMYPNAPVTLVTAQWQAYLGQWLEADAATLANDALVPSPLMPHLLLDWLVDRAKARWPQRAMAIRPLVQAPPTPWERAAPDGRHYVSYATWTCPVNCIEPAKCPATRGERSWSMPQLVEHVAADDPRIAGAITFHCRHRTYGVGMIDASELVDADQRVAHWGRKGPTKVLVGTVSHCHGALGLLSVE